MNAPLAFVDCETTGVHPGRRPWEIAVIRREPDGGEHATLIQIADIDLSEADLFGLRVGRFYERHWSYGGIEDDSTHYVSERHAATLVEQLTRGAHLVGAVPNFDAETFAAMLRRHRLVPAWHYHLIDVETLAVGYLNATIRGYAPSDPLVVEHSAVLGLPWRSDDLSRACGVEPPSEEDRHTALGDALWAKRWYDALIGAAA